MTASTTISQAKRAWCRASARRAKPRVSGDFLAGEINRVLCGKSSSDDDMSMYIPSLKRIDCSNFKKSNNMNQTRPSWDEYFMNIALEVATRSNCATRHVAAIIMRDKRIISTGYNGTPRNTKNCCDGGCERCAKRTLETAGQNLSECTCSHGEENAIVQAAYHGISTKDATLYTTFSPCLTCAKMIINAGIQEVVFNSNYPLGTRAAELLTEANVTLRQFSAKEYSEEHQTFETKTASL